MQEMVFQAFSNLSNAVSFCPSVIKLYFSLHMC